MRITRVDQIAIVVEDLEEALATYKRVFGLEPEFREVIESSGIEEAMIDVGGVYIQLIQPTRPDSRVAAHLAEHGPGLHHIGYGVEDLDEAVAHARRAGAGTEGPRPGGRGHRIAFVLADDVTGVRTELIQDEPGDA